jgi:hypothetical protein
MKPWTVYQPTAPSAAKQTILWVMVLVLSAAYGAAYTLVFHTIMVVMWLIVFAYAFGLAFGVYQLARRFGEVRRGRVMALAGAAALAALYGEWYLHAYVLGMGFTEGGVDLVIALLSAIQVDVLLTLLNPLVLGEFVVYILQTGWMSMESGDMPVAGVMYMAAAGFEAVVLFYVAMRYAADWATGLVLCPECGTVMTDRGWSGLPRQSNRQTASTLAHLDGAGLRRWAALPPMTARDFTHSDARAWDCPRCQIGAAVRVDFIDNSDGGDAEAVSKTVIAAASPVLVATVVERNALLRSLQRSGHNADVTALTPQNELNP